MFDRRSWHAGALCVLATFMLAAGGCASGQTFATPEEAMQAVAGFAGTLDRKKVEAIFGPGATEVLWSGDDVADREDGERVRDMILKRVEIIHDGDDWAMAEVGDERWQFPVPLVRSSKGWRFDLAAGREEIHNRRVGRNELHAIATLHACVDAQREYASVSRDGEPIAYAQKFWSSPGLHDGLYWPTAAGEPESPMGPLVSEAAEEGYRRGESGPVPYHGYYFKILTRQGKSAPGGAKSYVDAGGRMTGGFAAVAWPATYGNSGVMTFIVNQLGVVYQQDLGRPSDASVPPVTAYDPGEDWEPVRD
jgi:hypothetical protein